MDKVELGKRLLRLKAEKKCSYDEAMRLLKIELLFNDCKNEDEHEKKEACED